MRNRILAPGVTWSCSCHGLRIVRITIEISPAIEDGRRKTTDAGMIASALHVTLTQDRRSHLGFIQETWLIQPTVGRVGMKHNVRRKEVVQRLESSESIRWKCWEWDATHNASERNTISNQSGDKRDTPIVPIQRVNSQYIEPSWRSQER